MVGLLLAVQTATNVVKMYMEPYLKKKAELDAEDSRKKGYEGVIQKMSSRKGLSKKLSIDIIHLALVFIIAIFAGYSLNNYVTAINKQDEATVSTENIEVAEENIIDEQPLIDKLPKEVYEQMDEKFQESGVEEAAIKLVEQYKKEFEIKYREDIEKRAIELFLEE